MSAQKVHSIHTYFKLIQTHFLLSSASQTLKELSKRRDMWDGKWVIKLIKLL